MPINDPPNEKASGDSANPRTGRAPAHPLTNDLVLHIRRIIASRGLGQREAAAIIGITQPNLSSYLKHNHPHRLSLPRLLQCLNALGHDVEITVTPMDKMCGEISLICEDWVRPEARPALPLSPPSPAPPSGAASLEPAPTQEEGSLPLNIRLANHICRTLDRRGITRGAAASLFVISRQRVSDLYNPRPRKFSLQSLLHFLNLLQCNVEITVTPARKERGETFLAIL